MNASLARMPQARFGKPLLLGGAAVAVCAVLAVASVSIVRTRDNAPTKLTFQTPYVTEMQDVGHTFVIDGISFTLIAGNPDDDQTLSAIVAPREGHRLAFFVVHAERATSVGRLMGIEQRQQPEPSINRDSIVVVTDDGLVEPFLVSVNGIVPPVPLDLGSENRILAIFELPADAKERELQATFDGADEVAAWVFTDDDR
jgi:hypothetical protein